MGPEASEDLTASTVALLDRPTAALWRRATARAIDAATVFFMLWALVVSHVFWFMGDLSDRVDPSPWRRAFVATVTYVVMYAAYEVVFLTRSMGQTPGRDVMKVRVVPLDGSGQLGAARAAGRWLLPGAALIVPPVWLGVSIVIGQGVITAALPRGRGAHDRLAGTVVVDYDRTKEDPTSAVPSRRSRRRQEREAEELALHRGIR
jgi:uncharacterized RDD family membrane protein YckC